MQFSSPSPPTDGALFDKPNARGATVRDQFSSNKILPWICHLSAVNEETARSNSPKTKNKSKFKIIKSEIQIYHCLNGLPTGVKNW